MSFPCSTYAATESDGGMTVDMTDGGEQPIRKTESVKASAEVAKCRTRTVFRLCGDRRRGRRSPGSVSNIGKDFS